MAVEIVPRNQYGDGRRVDLDLARKMLIRAYVSAHRAYAKPNARHRQSMGEMKEAMDALGVPFKEPTSVPGT